ncbi:hypothetical protein Hanom_Chr02g00107511 [Helianthus anomalus]
MIAHSRRRIPKKEINGLSKEDELGIKEKQKRDAGYKNVSTNNRWAVVEKDMGYDHNDGALMRMMYAMYLDVLVYY